MKSTKIKGGKLDELFIKAYSLENVDSILHESSIRNILNEEIINKNVLMIIKYNKTWAFKPSNILIAWINAKNANIVKIYEIFSK